MPVLILLTAACIVPSGCQNLTSEPDNQSFSRVTIVEDFRLGEIGEQWSFRTPDLWRIITEGDRHVLQMAEPPERDMLPGVRRPQEYAVYVGQRFRSFNLSCRVRIDNDPGIRGRDACIIFGRADDTHFYYVHLSNHADPFHNALVRVDGDTRQSLLPPGKTPPLAITDRQWHKVDILRDADAGAITIYVDAYNESAKPWCRITDRTYEWGHVALGSFNDHASFAHLIIEGEVR